MMNGANNTKITGFIDLSSATPITGSNNLWSYHKQGTIYGVPVRLSDRGLNIDTLKDLTDAFNLNSLIKVWSGWLSPEFKNDLLMYQLIKQLLADNKCVILLQQMQYSTVKNAYLVLITYAAILFLLNDRYSFYKLDLIHE